MRVPVWRAVTRALCFLSLAGAGVAIANVQVNPHPTFGYSMFAFFFAIAMLVSIGPMLFSRCEVEVAKDGFVVRYNFSTRAFRWDEVSEFTIATLTPGRGTRQTYVVFDRDGPVTAMDRFNRILSGKSDPLPMGLEPAVPEGGNAVRVAAVMNTWRERYLADTNADSNTDA